MEHSTQKNIHLKKVKQESKENYMRAIYMLGFQKLNGVRYVDLEEYFGFSKASVCKAVRALRDEGFVSIGENFRIELTLKGQEVARKTYEKYCFFKELLIGAGIELEQAEAEACKLEHGISSRSLSNLINIYACKKTESQKQDINEQLQVNNRTQTIVSKC